MSEGSVAHRYSSQLRSDETLPVAIRCMTMMLSRQTRSGMVESCCRNRVSTEVSWVVSFAFSGSVALKSSFSRSIRRMSANVSRSRWINDRLMPAFENFRARSSNRFSSAVPASNPISRQFSDRLAIACNAG